MEQMDTDLFDLTIIGGGPTGLFAIFYAGMRRMRTKVIEALPQLGGQLTALYPEKDIFDVGGFPSVIAKDLSKNLEKQAFKACPDCAVCLGEKVTGLEKQPDGSFKLTTDKGVHHTKAVLITAGIGAFAPRRVNIPGEVEFEGKGVTYNVTDPEEYRGTDVLIIGGGDSAVDYALMLEKVAKSVTIIHRRDQFRAHEETVEQMLHSTVNVKVFYEPKALIGSNSHVEGAIVFHNKTKEEETLTVNRVILGTGFVANLGEITQWGLEIPDGRSIAVNSKCETNIAGVYAAGDIATYPGKLKLIATGFGEAATAVNNAKSYIDPSAKAFPGHSSETMATKH